MKYKKNIKSEKQTPKCGTLHREPKTDENNGANEDKIMDKDEEKQRG